MCFDLGFEEVKKISIWACWLRLPMDLWSEKILKSIGHLLGKYMDVDISSSLV